jgi:hypothetical protein
MYQKDRLCVRQPSTVNRQLFPHEAYSTDTTSATHRPMQFCTAENHRGKMW